jgi:simple sugar transport system permease protein|tara:strand:- start:4677 stop:5615 length:939 start_codon:yes stop_codon:yes gene_type:complete
MFEFFDVAAILAVLSAAIRMSMPIIIAAMGELVSQKSGVINLGLEGVMLMGCFVGFYATYTTGSHLQGIMWAIGAGILMNLIFGLITVVLKLEQYIAGLAMNILASGLTLYWFRELSEAAGESPRIELIKPIEIPLLCDIPFIGELLFKQSIFIYLTVVIVPLVWFFLYRTRYGLEIRCLGDNPHSLDAKGLGITRRRMMAVLFAGAMAGLAGAFISVGSSVRFVPEMIAGRGWLAIIVVIAGSWLPTKVVITGFVFALIGAVQLHSQTLGLDVPHQLLLALPYIMAIVLLIIKRDKATAPATLGIPYKRGK